MNKSRIIIVGVLVAILTMFGNQANAQSFEPVRKGFTRESDNTKPMSQ